MAKRDNTILGKLNAKKVELAQEATRSTELAEYHRSQIAGAEAAAKLSAAQAAAVEEALSILNKAGVVV